MVALRFRTFILCALVSIMLFFLGNRFLYSAFHVIQSGASLIVYPVVKLQHILLTTMQKIVVSRQKKIDLKSKILELRTANEQLVAENIDLKASQEYFEATRELIDFKRQYGVEHALLAQVIMKQFSAYGHFFLVDCGSHHGMSNDMVAVYKNCLIGRVTHVYPFYSKITLISDADCKVAAYCRLSKARGIHEGCNTSDAASLEFVSHLHQLKEHDLIISSGEGLVFPQGFGLGKISSFKLNGLHYKITVKPLLNFDEIAYCYLIKKSCT